VADQPFPGTHDFGSGAAERRHVFGGQFGQGATANSICSKPKLAHGRFDQRLVY
jgi:hypothetical protein